MSAERSKTEATASPEILSLRVNLYSYSFDGESWPGKCVASILNLMSFFLRV